MKLIILDGYFCRQQQRETRNGYMVSFGFNSPDNKRNQDGSWDSTPDFYDCVYFYHDERDGTAAQIMAGDGKYRLFAVPHTDKYEKDGREIERKKYTVDAIKLLSKSKKSTENLADDEIPF